MGTIYIDRIAFWKDEDGTIYESEKKKFKYSITLPEKKEEPKGPNPLECHCGFIAKSNAGLAVHKMKHKES